MKMQKLTRWMTLGTAVSIAMLGVGLLIEAPAVAAGIRRGLELCAGVLIPSLFPFMVLASFLAMTQYARILSIPLRPLTTRVLKLPGEFGVVVLLSLIGGYPVGAKMIAQLLEQGRIDRTTAERMLCFCVNSGPSFLISAVGVGMLFSRTAGVILFATQTAATLLIGWFVSLRVERPKNRVASPRSTPPGTALVLAVQSATGSMLSICAFSILFSGLLPLLTEGRAFELLAAALPMRRETALALFSGLLEVTSGCTAAAGLGGSLGFGICSVLVSLCGLSVIFQIGACFGATPVRLGPMLRCRALHALMSTAMAVPLYNKFCGLQSAMLGAGVQPLPAQSDHRTALVSVCLLGMCAIFTLSLGGQAAPEKRRSRRFLEEIPPGE